jgi:outer membrane protein OmpA-like peptidoglycan-associated protein
MHLFKKSQSTLDFKTAQKTGPKRTGLPLLAGSAAVLLAVIAMIGLDSGSDTNAGKTANAPLSQATTQALAALVAPPGPDLIATTADQPAAAAPQDELALVVAAAMARDAELKARREAEILRQKVAEQAATAPQAPPLSARSAQADCVTALDSFLAPVILRFELGSTAITPQEADRLAQISDRIITCPQAYVLVAGHSDSSGDDATNMALSWERADRALNHLVALGVNPKAVEAVGFGARAPISEGSDDEDAADRRVDFRVLRIRSE